jgi:hypothetical protein
MICLDELPVPAHLRKRARDVVLDDVIKAPASINEALASIRIVLTRKFVLGNMGGPRLGPPGLYGRATRNDASRRPGKDEQAAGMDLVGRLRRPIA